MKLLLIRPRPEKETIGLQHVMIVEPLELDILGACKRKQDSVTIIDMIIEKKSTEYFLKINKPRVLPIGAQSSVTGGATPLGEVVLSTARMSAILEIQTDRVRVQPGLAISSLQEALAAVGRYYPPFTTYTGAFVGGVVATNASGAGTFKGASTRDWVEALTVVQRSGEVLDLERGHVLAHPDGYFEIEHAGVGGSEGPPCKRTVTRIPVPTYRMPDVAKRSAGYFAAPEMDLIDLFVGSEGTLGVITEITFRVLPRLPAVALAIVFVKSEPIPAI